MRQDGFITIDRATIARLPAVGCTAMGVYLIVASYANQDRQAWPSIETISLAAGVSERTVRRSLRALEEVGLVTQTQRRRETAVYTIQDRPPVADQEPIQDRPSMAVQGPRPAKNDPKTGQKRPSRPAKSARGTTIKERHSRTTGSFDPLSADLPFDSERFRQSWQDFAEHRRASKHPLSEAAAARILKKLSAWGEPKAVDALDASIESGWRGVFEPRSNGKTAGERKCRVPTDEELANWTPYGGNGHDG